jgi:hypothetical protein
MSDDVENFITQWLLRFHGILKALGQVKELVKFARCERLIQSPLVLEIHAPALQDLFNALLSPQRLYAEAQKWFTCFL